MNHLGPGEPRPDPLEVEFVAGRLVDPAAHGGEIVRADSGQRERRGRMERVSHPAARQRPLPAEVGLRKGDIPAVVPAAAPEQPERLLVVGVGEAAQPLLPEACDRRRAVLARRLPLAEILAFGGQHRQRRVAVEEVAHERGPAARRARHQDQMPFPGA